MVQSYRQKPFRLKSIQEGVTKFYSKQAYTLPYTNCTLFTV